MSRIARLAVAAALLGSFALDARARCSSPTDQAAFDVGALKSEMSVLAVGCSDEDDYNRFIERTRSVLLSQDAVVNAWFKKTYGRVGQARYDSYITLLANEQGLKGQHEGSDFCPRSKALFTEAALVPLNQMAQFAAAKDVIPKEELACDVAAPVSRVAAGRNTHTTARRKK